MYHARSISSERKNCTAPCPQLQPAVTVCSQQAYTQRAPIYTTYMRDWLHTSQTCKALTCTQTAPTHSWPRFPSFQCGQRRDLLTQERPIKEFNKKTRETAHTQPALFILLPFFSHTCSSLNQLNPSLFPILYSFPKHPAKSLCNPKMLFPCIP